MKKFSFQQVNPLEPMRVVIYGIEGVGKTTLIGRSTKPVIITPEGGANRVKTRDGKPIQELKGIENFDDLLGAIKFLIEEPHDFKTLGLDSVDWIEKLAHEKIIGDSGKDIIRVNGGYGTGYADSERLHRMLLRGLKRLQAERGMHVIVTGHSEVKQVKDPEMMHDYDAYRLKCHEKVSSLWREWSDTLLFVRFATYTTETESADRARALGDGKRIIYTVHRPSFQAKNRYNLEDEQEFTLDYWDVLENAWQAGAVESTEERLDQVKLEIDERVSKIDDEDQRNSVLKYLASAGDDLDKLIVARKRLREMQGAAA